jgi:hypothetical protein
MPARRTRMSPMANMPKMAAMALMKRIPPPPAEADIIAAGGRVVTTPTGAKVITVPALRESDALAGLPRRCELYCVGGYSA